LKEFMVLPVSESVKSEGSQWKWSVIAVFVASIVCGGVFWWVSSDLRTGFFAFCIPLFMAAFFLAVFLIFGVGTIPLMLLVSKLTKKPELKNKTKKE